MPEPRPSLPETITAQPVEPNEQPTLPEPTEAATIPPPDGDELAAVTIPPRHDASSLLGAEIQIPGYEILGKLGEGGMGLVYKARHLGLNRLVALKMIRPGYASDDMLKRFQAEAEAVAKLQHPNIVQIYDINQHNGCPFFALEYIEGGSLDKLLAGTPQPPDQAAQLVATLAEAMQAAHAKNIIHRDLKPANVLLGGGTTEDTEHTEKEGKDHAASFRVFCVFRGSTPKITDFGLAKQLDADSGQTKTGAIMGTPSYMAPEQASGKKDLTPAADIYALGAILYELLTGRPPFKAATPLDTVLQVISDEPVPPRQLQSKVPRDLETICLKCLQKDPAKRYEAARGLAADLRRFVNGEPIQARPVGQVERLRRWCRRKPVVAGLVGAVIVVLVVGTVVSAVLANWAFSEGDRADTNATTALKNADEAQAKAAQTRHEEERTQVVNGLRLTESGDVLNAFHWFAQPLAGTTPSDAEEQHRHRLEMYWRQLPKLTPTASYSEAVKSDIDFGTKFSADGTRCISVSLKDKSVRICDLHSGQTRTVRLQPSNRINRVVLSADGSRLAMLGDDSTAQVWNTNNGELVMPALTHDGGISYVMFSPDSSSLATASFGNTVRMWDIATGQPIGPPLTHETRVYWAVASPNGLRLTTFSGEMPSRVGVIGQVWEISTGRAIGLPVVLVASDRTNLLAQAFTPDGRYLVLVANEQSTKLIDVTTGQPLTVPILDRARIASAAFSPNGDRIVVVVDSAAHIVDTSSGRVLTPPMEPADAAYFSPMGNRVVTVSLKRNMRVWEAATGKHVTPPIPSSRDIHSVRFTSDGRLLVAGNALWDAVSGQFLAFLLDTWGVPSDVKDLAPDSRRFFSVGRNGPLELWDLAKAKEATNPVLRHSDQVGYAAFSPNGRHVITASADKTARIWDSVTGEPTCPPLQHQAIVTLAAFSPNGMRVVTASWDKTARVWDVTGKQPHGLTLPHQGVVTHASFSPDGQRVVTATLDGDIQVWDTTDGKRLPIRFDYVELLKHGHRAVYSPDGSRIVTTGQGQTRGWEAATGRMIFDHPRNEVGTQWWEDSDFTPFSRDGRYLVTADNGTVVVRDAATCRRIIGTIEYLGGCSSVSLSHDGSLVLIVSNGNARVWHVRTGQPHSPPFLDQRGVVCASFSPDGRRVVTASKDGTARVWDASNGLPITPPLLHAAAVVHAVFSPDGRFVLSASSDSTARVWDVSPDNRSSAEWVSLARALGGHSGGAQISPQQGKQEVLPSNSLASRHVTPAQARAWHQREAEACVKEQNPAAALFHTLYGCDLNWAVGWGTGK